MGALNDDETFEQATQLFFKGGWTVDYESFDSEKGSSFDCIKVVFFLQGRLLSFSLSKLLLAIPKISFLH